MITLLYYFKLELRELINTVNYQTIREKIDFGRKISSICKKLCISEEDLILNRCRHLAYSYYKSSFSSVLNILVNTSKGSDSDYDYEALIQKYEQTLDEDFFVGEVEAYVEYHLSKIKESFLKDDSFIKVKSRNIKYDYIDTLNEVIVDELQKNYNKFSFSIGPDVFISKTIGINQIFINILKRYKKKIDADKTKILVSLLTEYGFDEIDKYSIINKVDASTNIIFDEYLINNISFHKKTGNSPHSVHQLFALISLFPDIELKLAVTKGVLVALNKKRIDDLIFTGL